MPLTIVATEAPVPVTGRARTSAAHDPDLLSLYNDTLKPRGIPSSTAVTLRFDTKADAERDLRGLRAIAKADVPALTIGSDLKPETDGGDEKSPHLLSVWIKGEFTPRPRTKDETTTETPADAAPVTDETLAEVPTGQGPTGFAPIVDETPAETPVFQEPEPDHHGKKQHRFGF